MSEETKTDNLAQPPSQPGPTINNRATILTAFTPQTLATLPSLPSLISLINAAYSSGECHHFHAAGHKRLSSPAHLLSELGSTSRIFVLRFDNPSPDSDDEFPDGLIACGVNQPALGHDDAGREEMLEGLDRMNGAFHRRGEAARLVPGVAEWDLKLMAVAPGLFRRGIAGWILGRLERDIRERNADGLEGAEEGVVVGDDKGVSGDGGEMNAEGKIRVRITTWAEMNEGFYTKRGFKVVGKEFVPAGEEGVGGSKPFHIVHMDKWLS